MALHEGHQAVCVGEAGFGQGGRFQTDRDTKLLYCWMFLLRISEQGPSTRSNRGRSSFTHFKRPRATTVAARGRFISRAISPRARGEGKEPSASTAGGKEPARALREVNRGSAGFEADQSKQRGGSAALLTPCLDCWECWSRVHLGVLGMVE